MAEGGRGENPGTYEDESPVEEEYDDSYDPFGKNIDQAQLIVSMKIYDVLLALLRVQAPAEFEALEDAHSRGIILGLGPVFSHFFNRDQETDTLE